ncbi:biotin-dependent carboxyltransferase family protein [Larsenimonas salina]|uniref:5-oxoprolinase subunit C family protein n=1 Tax=Larsenimonas salina TaxID=1295565 RepID=UPI002073C7BD|nr:biotin-dependent carboxyltransferase family protein [Larsenimonas salina]MCM5703755.1 biotin-dependent carboxyltransferase family protein [Larsenimonas salina]
MTDSASCSITRLDGGCRVQDLGRFGVRHLGLGQGGGFDHLSLRVANALLGNAHTAPVLEITLGQVALTFSASTTVALTGADLGARLDHVPVSPGGCFVVEGGQTLMFDTPVQGLRSYLAVAGGFEVAPELGSVTALAREPLGGLHGEGDELTVGDALTYAPGFPSLRTQPDATRWSFDEALVLDVVVGLQAATFSGRSLFDAFNRPWCVDTRADSMGVRLEGPRLESRCASLVSEGLTPGVIQVPPDGAPIILGPDCQSIGGYPKFGAVTPYSLARLGQCCPGDTLHLRPVGIGLARARWAQWLGHLDGVESHGV